MQVWWVRGGGTEWRQGRGDRRGAADERRGERGGNAGVVGKGEAQWRGDTGRGAAREGRQGRGGRGAAEEVRQKR